MLLCSRKMFNVQWISARILICIVLPTRDYDNVTLLSCYLTIARGWRCFLHTLSSRSLCRSIQILFLPFLKQTVIIFVIFNFTVLWWANEREDWKKITSAPYTMKHRTEKRRKKLCTVCLACVRAYRGFEVVQIIKMMPTYQNGLQFKWNKAYIRHKKSVHLKFFFVWPNENVTLWACKKRERDRTHRLRQIDTEIKECKICNKITKQSHSQRGRKKEK